jgi:hypothetical protein
MRFLFEFLTGVTLTIFKYSVPVFHEIRFLSATKINRFKEIVPVYSENHRKLVNKLSGQDVAFF